MRGPAAAARGVTPKLSIAPMMDWTDTHYRWLMRRITRRTLLYTEMVVADAILRGDRDRLLGFHEVEHPVAVQLGGDDPAKLAEAARIAVARGYDEINLNVGCPSDRVQSGRFGACLMAHPDVVARCAEALLEAVAVPVTVKHRIGIDDLDRYEHMHHFVVTVAAAGVTRFSVHARKAWLQGLSPKENRTVPPLRYPDVYRLKAELPHLDIEINGGVRSLDEAEQHLAHVDAVMIGRGAYESPWIFHEADTRLLGATAPEAPARTRDDVALALADYVDRHRERLGKPNRAARHALHLYAGEPGAKAWKQVLSREGNASGAGGDVVRRALAAVREKRQWVAERAAARAAAGG